MQAKARCPLRLTEFPVGPSRCFLCPFAYLVAFSIQKCLSVFRKPVKSANHNVFVHRGLHGNEAAGKRKSKESRVRREEGAAGHPEHGGGWPLFAAHRRRGRTCDTCGTRCPERH